MVATVLKRGMGQSGALEMDWGGDTEDGLGRGHLVCRELRGGASYIHGHERY